MTISHLGEVHLRKAEAAADDGNLDKAKGLYMKAIGCYDPSALAAAEARLGLAAVYAEDNQLDEAWEALSEAVSVLREAQNHSVAHARALNQMGLIKRRQEAFDRARELHVEARAVASEAGDLRQQAVALRNLAAVERSGGELTRAVVLLRESAELLMAEGERRGVALIWRQVRTLELESNRLHAAFQAGQRELALREELGEQAAIAATLVESARVARLLGSRTQAEEWLNRAAELRMRMGDMEGAARALLDAATLLLESGRPRGARRKLEAARDAMGEGGPIDQRAELWRGFAETDLAMLEAYVHEFDPTLRLDRESLDNETTTDDALEKRQLLRRAREEADEALMLARQSSSVVLRAAALRTVARASSLLGEVAGAREQFRAGIATTDELGPQTLDALLLGPYNTFLAYGVWLGRQGCENSGEVAATDRRAAKDYLERASILAEDARKYGLSAVYAVRARAALALHHLRANEPEFAHTALAQARSQLESADDSPADPLGTKLRRILDQLAAGVAPARRVGTTSSDEVLRTAEEKARIHVAKVIDDELRDALYDLRRLAEITKALNSEYDLERLLDLIMDVAIELVGAERGFLILTGAGGDVAFKVARNIERTEVERPDRKVSNTIARAAIESGQPVVTDDAVQDERFAGAMSVAEQGLRSVISVPLRMRGTITGALYLDHRYKGGIFGAREIELLEGLADHAAVTLENARLAKVEQERASNLRVEARLLNKRIQSQTAELETVRRRLAEKTRAESSRYQYDQIVGRSPAMTDVFRLLDKVVPSNIPVFIHGESGTGKELIARAIHYNGPRKDGPFISENFAAIVDELVASELFGHVKGSFTGALEDKKGLFERAHGGTIFLDEVGDLSEQMQKELLRVLEERRVRPVGAGDTISVDVRLISATHRDLKQMVAEGTFRQDLFYRLHVFAIRLPPLRDRRQDVPLLAERFLEAYAQEQKQPIRSFTPEAMRKLMSFRWPGNVRELKNFVDRTSLLCKDDQITEEDINFDNDGDTLDAIEDLSLARWSEAKEGFARRYLTSVLLRVGGNISVAARESGMLRQAFQRLLKRYGIDPAEYRVPRRG